MRAWMLSLVLSLLILVKLAIAVEPLSQFEADNHAMDQIFREACELSKYDCDGVEQPIVRRSSQLESMDIYGLYAGGKILWVGNDVMPLRARQTMFHEAIHYLQVQVGGLDPEMVGHAASCVAEREALELSNAYARMKKMPEAYIRSVDEWKRIYRC